MVTKPRGIKVLKLKIPQGYEAVFLQILLLYSNNQKVDTNQACVKTNLENTKKALRGSAVAVQPERFVVNVVVK